MEKAQQIQSLFEQMRPLLVGECLSSLGARAYGRLEVEDLLQQVCCVALEHSDKVLSSPNPQGWMILCCRNICMNAGQKLQRQQRILGRQVELQDQDMPSADLITAWMRKDAAQSLLLQIKQALNENETEIFHEYFELGYSIRQVSQLHGLTESAAKARIHRIRQKAIKLSAMNGALLILCRIMGVLRS